MTILFRLRRRPDAPAPPTLDDWAAIPPHRRQYLSREEFAAKFGASQTDLDLVAEFASSSGLQVRQINVAGRAITASGTAGQINNAFHIELARYDYHSETYRGFEGQIYMPENLVDIVESIFGLDWPDPVHRSTCCESRWLSSS